MATEIVLRDSYLVIKRSQKQQQDFCKDLQALSRCWRINCKRTANQLAPYPTPVNPQTHKAAPKSGLVTRLTALRQFLAANCSACSTTSWLRSFFSSPCTCLLNSSTLLDQFIEQNFGPHIEQKAASL